MNAITTFEKVSNPNKRSRNIKKKKKICFRFMKNKKLIQEIVSKKSLIYKKSDLKADLEKVVTNALISKDEEIKDLHLRLQKSGADVRKQNYEILGLKDKIRQLENDMTKTASKLISKISENAKINIVTTQNGVETCSVCGNVVRTYKRSVYSRIAAGLINLHKLSKGNSKYFHVSDFIINSSDFAKLEFWGLIQEMPKDKADKTTRTSGYWRTTIKGNSFVENKTTITKYIHLKNNNLIARSGEQVGIKDCLNEKFNYEQLMTSI